MDTKIKTGLIHLLSFSILALFLCISCSKEEEQPTPRIELSRYRVLVDKHKLQLQHSPVFGRPDIREVYRVYRYDDRSSFYIPYIIGFDSVYGGGGLYYQLEIREEAVRNVEDGGSTFYLERVVDRYSSLIANPFD